MWIYALRAIVVRNKREDMIHTCHVLKYYVRMYMNHKDKDTCVTCYSSLHLHCQGHVSADAATFTFLIHTWGCCTATQRAPPIHKHQNKRLLF